MKKFHLTRIALAVASIAAMAVTLGAANKWG